MSVEQTHRARTLRSHPTEAEQRLWYFLRRRQLDGVKFRRQFPIGVFIVDFLCLEKRLIVEVDGGQHVERMRYDQRRDAWLEAQGFRVLRFWNDEVLKQTTSVVEVIRARLEDPSPPP